MQLSQPLSDETIRTLITVGGVLAGALLGSLTTMLVQFLQRRGETRRWYAEFFMKDRLETVRNLYAALVDLHEAVSPYANPAITPHEEMSKEVTAKYKALARHEALAYPYIDARTWGVIMSARMFLMMFWMKAKPDSANAIPDPQFKEKLGPLTWESVEGIYEEARATLEPLISPEILRRITKIK